MTKTSKLTTTALLGAMAAVLMFLETPLPFFPPFLKLDFSDLPAVVGAFAAGPLSGLGVVLIKNLVHMLSTKTAFAGEVANFLVGAAFVLPAGYIYKKKHTKKGALLGLSLGTLSMAAVGIVVNLFITLPLYSTFMPIEAIIAQSAKANSLITNSWELVLYGITPFNLFKGALLSVITLLVYKPLSPILHRSIGRKNHRAA